MIVLLTGFKGNHEIEVKVQTFCFNYFLNFLQPDILNCKINSLDPLSTDLFHRYYVNVYNNIY